MISATSTCAHVRVHVVHLDDVVVRNLGFRQQHVHVARHPSGDRVDDELHRRAACRELVVQFRDAVLRVRDRHAVARHDDDEARHLERLRGALDRFFLVVPFFAAGGGPACTWPKPPNSTFVNERFIARHMMIDRIRPLAPSSAPATTSRRLSSTKPIATADKPAYAFRIEITVGMSAPPIGMISSTPNASDSTISIGNANIEPAGIDDQEHTDRKRRAATGRGSLKFCIG